MNLHWIDFGSLPDWVEAVGTAGALIYIAVQSHQDRRKSREDRREALDERRDLEAAQARLVSVSIGWGFGAFGHEAVGRVYNHSSGPISDVATYLKDLHTVATSDPLPQDRPTTAAAALVLPGEYSGFTIYPPRRIAAPRDGNDSAAYQAPMRTFEVCVEFTDAKGLRWSRVGSEQPKRLILR